MVVFGVVVLGARRGCSRCSAWLFSFLGVVVLSAYSMSQGESPQKKRNRHHEYDVTILKVGVL